MGDLRDIAGRTARSNDMLPAAAPVVAMVSGGADSVALLRLLASGSLGEVRLAALHVDHMLRGGQSDEDARFVEALCASLGVPCRVARYDVSAYAAAERLNLEDAGRRVRYRFAEEELDSWCASLGASPKDGRIAVAHTFDDRMETFVMRVIQGAGAGGLSSIPYVRGRVVRPLLDARRSDVVAYLGEAGQAWREDATNADTTRLRARVRAEVLPLLEAINPRFDGSLARTLAVLSDEDALLEAAAREAAGQVATSSSGCVRIDRAGLAGFGRPMQRRVLRAAIFGAFPDASRLDHSHVEALLDSLGDDRLARDLPCGLRAESEYDTLVISRSGSETGPLAPSLLDVPGVVDLGEGGSLSAAPAGSDEIDDDPMTALVDAERVRPPFTVDSVTEGDRMRPLGMRGRRKLSDLLTDAKVPRRLRPVIPVVRSAGEVVWLAGVRQSEEHRVSEGTSRAVRLTWTGPARQEEQA